MSGLIQRWRRPRATQVRVVCLPLLWSACLAGWPARAAGAEPVKAPPLALPTNSSEQEAGAAALLDGEPLQVGLREGGLPEPVGPSGSTISPTAPNPPSTPTSAPTVAPTPAPAPTPVAAPARLLILDRRHRLLQVLENGREVRRYPVAVGMPGWETPVGSFTVIEKTKNPTWEHPANGHLLPPGPENPLGSRWIGFYRDCRGRSGFNGQEHLVVKGCVTAGFHGTPNRSSVGRAVSHGCVRLFDEHAKELFDLVSLGTPVRVLP
ncbi:MAG: L,D-transpeptidase [Cyanobacteriota bacterium]